MIIIILSAAAITESCRGNRWGRALQNTVTDWSPAQKATSSSWWVQGGGRGLWAVTIYTIWSSKHQRNVETSCCHPLQISLLFATQGLSYSLMTLWFKFALSPSIFIKETLHHKSNFKFSNEDCQCQTLGGGAQGYNRIQSISHDQHLQCSSIAYKWITSESEQQPHTAAQIAIVSLLLLLHSRKKIMHIPTEPILNSSYTRFLRNSCFKSLKSIQDRCNRVTRGSIAAVTRPWDGWSQFPIKAE